MSNDEGSLRDTPPGEAAKGSRGEDVPDKTQRSNTADSGKLAVAAETLTTVPCEDKFVSALPLSYKNGGCPDDWQIPSRWLCRSPDIDGLAAVVAADMVRLPRRQSRKTQHLDTFLPLLASFGRGGCKSGGRHRSR